MNEKLEAFRRRLREPEKKKTDWASWIGSPTAQFAAVLSLFNLFYSHAYYSDELIVGLSPSRVGSDYADSIEVELPRQARWRARLNSFGPSVCALPHKRPPSRPPIRSG